MNILSLYMLEYINIQYCSQVICNHMKSVQFYIVEYFCLFWV